MAIQVETMEMSQAFAYYYSLGADRTYDKVAEEYNKNLQTITNWGRSFGWRSRVAALDIEAGRKLREKLIHTTDDDVDEYRKIIKASLASYVTELKSGNIKVTKIRDVINLIELDLKLTGISDDDSVKVSDETSNTINQLLVSIESIIEESE